MTDPASRDDRPPATGVPTPGGVANDAHHHAKHRRDPLSRIVSGGILALVIVVILLLIWIF